MKNLVFIILLGFLGCTYYQNCRIVSGLTEFDERFTREGWNLKCTQILNNQCLTHQWTQNNIIPEVIYENND